MLICCAIVEAPIYFMLNFIDKSAVVVIVSSQRARFDACVALGHSLSAHAEKVAREGGLLGHLLFGIDVVLTVVLGTAADVLECLEARRRGCVCIDVDGLAALDILEQSHRGVASIVLHHLGVRLAAAHVVRRVLEDAALAIGALGGVIKEVLADRCQVLSAESLLFL